MARPKKKPEYNSAEIAKQIVEAVTDAYLNPTEDDADEQGHTYLNLLAEEFSMTPIKVRKLLITSGAYETPTSIAVNKLYKDGKNVKEIQQIMGLSSASVNGYLPYNKAVYNLEEATLTAERLRKYRQRKAAVEKLRVDMEFENTDEVSKTLWETLLLFEGYPFVTAKGLRYYYTIKGNEMFFTRKEKSVTRATVNIALQTAIKLQKDGIQITGPKMLGCFGASYLYPIFIRIGVISISDGDKKT